MSILLGVVVGLVLGLTGAGGSILAVPLLMAGLELAIRRKPRRSRCSRSPRPRRSAAYLAWRRQLRALSRGDADVDRRRADLAAGPACGRAACRPPRCRCCSRRSSASPRSGSMLQSLAQRRRRRRACQQQPHCAASIRSAAAWSGPGLSGAVLAAIGAVTGFLSGLLGVGGGFFIVPALRAATELSMQAADRDVADDDRADQPRHRRQRGARSAATFRCWSRCRSLIGSLLGMAVRPLDRAEARGSARLQQGFALLMLLVAAGMATARPGTSAGAA
jgi:hypothetical protein